MAKLIVMVGLSGSGKSSIAKRLAEENNATIISSDLIREELGDYAAQDKNAEVFKIFHNRIKDNLMYGNNVIADATNITIKTRRNILENIKKIKCEKVAYVVAKRFYDCYKDNHKREHVVPDHILRNQMLRFQIPFYEEGWDEIIVDHLGYEYFPVHEVSSNMRNFNQKSKWHNETLDNHCTTVEKLFCEKYPEYDLAAAYHDCGKPYCQTFGEDGEAHYYGHDSIGAYILMTYFQTSTLDDLFLVNYHMMPFNWIKTKTHAKYKKIFGKDKYEMLLYFNECDKFRKKLNWSE